MPGCTVQIGEPFIMCRPHWGLVPADLRKDLHDAYQLARTAPQQRRVEEFAVACALKHITTAPSPHRAE